MSHQHFLDTAAAIAIESAQKLESISGAILVSDETVIAQSGNDSIRLNDPIAIAELNCIRQAGRRSDQASLTLYTTRYPNMLVAGTVMQFSIGAMVIGLPEHSNEAIELLRSRSVPITFVENPASMALNSDSSARN
jgi:tRNA(Arg) A34 adenosine deaminase TadA